MAKKFGGGSRKYTKPTTPEEQELDQFNIAEFLKIYDNTDFDEVEIGKGVTAKTDTFSLFKEAHILAKNYGMGGCRSFTEFIDMVDNESPCTIDVLLAIITEESRVSSGFRPKKVKRNIEVNPINVNSYLKETAHKEIVDRDQFGAFLMNHGVSMSKVMEAQKAFDDGKLTSPTDKFEDITPDRVYDPNFDLRAALKRLKKVKEESINFNIRTGSFGKKKT